QVSLYAKGPDPRGGQGEFYASTWDGELGQFITTFEGHPYLGESVMYPDMTSAFSKTVVEGGWLGTALKNYSEAEQRWIRNRASYGKLKEKIAEDFEHYVDGNKLSIGSWQELLSVHPEFFKETDINGPFIARFYDNQDLLDHSVRLHTKYKALHRVLDKDEVLSRHPAFREAVDKGLIAGGLEAPGITFNIKSVLRNMLNYLQNRGVAYFWDHEVDDIVFGDRDVIKAIRSGGQDIEADHFSFHTGAYGSALWKNTPVEPHIGGVLGRWMLLPKPEGFTLPVKIHGDQRREGSQQYPIVDVNLTPYTHPQKGTPYLALGGGYMYVGGYPFTWDQENMDRVDGENERVARLYLGSFYEKALAAGSIIQGKVMPHAGDHSHWMIDRSIKFTH
ncbi:MAG TPA: FAD-dependent oxidoreductase, partial [Candidatus Gracilibacteria bacterium]